MIFLDVEDKPESPPPPPLPFRPGAEVAEADSAATIRLDVKILLIVLLPLIDTTVVNTCCVVLPVAFELMRDVDVDPAMLDVSLEICV